MIVDDDRLFAETVCNALSGIFEVESAGSTKEFHGIYRPSSYDLLIVDMRLESFREGLSLVRDVLSLDPLQPVIVITAYADTESYLDAIDAGAIMFLDKGDFAPEVLARLVNAVLKQGQLQKRLTSMEQRLSTLEPTDIIGMNPKIKAMKNAISRAADDGEVTVLIRGESGTGKELVARNIHRLSRTRRNGPFVATSIPGIHQEAIYSELFGHVKGAFTGADRPRKGLFEEAGAGVLFLDEIGDLSLEGQLKLLRAIETRTFTRLGSNKEILVDVQIVTATNSDLERLVEKGLYRNDLYFRLRTFEIFVPPLREHKDDIPLLAQYFLQDLIRQGRCSVRIIGKEVLDYFFAYSWPGNIRELKSFIEYAAIQAKASGAGTLKVEHLPMRIKSEQSNTRSIKDYRHHIARAELSFVSDAINRHALKNKTELARILGYNDRITLARRIDRVFTRYPDLAGEFDAVADLFNFQAGKSLN
ncbi:MAG: sigma-54 dependent transcriptional regulator [Desulfatibacillaceae bacterium]|nr:sigma-54 dependent transcriptional regulator [Desulfatibacillaceae bacterium]